MGLLVTNALIEKAKEVHQKGKTRFNGNLFKATRYFSEHAEADKEIINDLIAKRDEALTNAAKLPANYATQKAAIVADFNQKIAEVMTPYLEIYYEHSKSTEFGKPLAIGTKIEDNFFEPVDMFEGNRLNHTVATLCEAVKSGKTWINPTDNEEIYDIKRYADPDPYAVVDLDPNKYVDRTNEELDFVERTIRSYEKDEHPDDAHKQMLDAAKLKRDVLQNAMKAVDGTGKKLSPAERRIAILDHITTQGLKDVIAKRNETVKQYNVYLEKEIKVEVGGEALDGFNPTETYRQEMQEAHDLQAEKVKFLDGQAKMAMDGADLTPYIDGQKKKLDDNVKDFDAQCKDKIAQAEKVVHEISGLRHEVQTIEHILASEKLENQVHTIDAFMEGYLERAAVEQAQLEGGLNHALKKEIEQDAQTKVGKLGYEIKKVKLNDTVTADGIRKRVTNEVKTAKSVASAENVLKGVDTDAQIEKTVADINFEAWNKGFIAKDEPKQEEPKKAEPKKDAETPKTETKKSLTIAEQFERGYEDLVTEYKANGKKGQDLIGYAKDVVAKTDKEAYNPDHNRIKRGLYVALNDKHASHGLLFKIFAFPAYLSETYQLHKLRTDISYGVNNLVHYERIKNEITPEKSRQIIANHPVAVRGFNEKGEIENVKALEEEPSLEQQNERFLEEVDKSLENTVSAPTSAPQTEKKAPDLAKTFEEMGG